MIQGSLNVYLGQEQNPSPHEPESKISGFYLSCYLFSAFSLRVCVCMHNSEKPYSIAPSGKLCKGIVDDYLHVSFPQR